MKDEIICILILASLIALFTFNFKTTDRVSKELSAEIIKAEKEAISDFDSKFEFGQVKKMWMKERKKLFYLCDQNVIEQIEESIKLGCEYLELGDRKNAVYMFKKARIMLNDLHSREKIKLDNFM